MKPFIEPTLEEVRLHAAKIGLPDIEAQLFYYHYGGNGWMVGKHNKMKNWKMSLAGWKLRQIKWNPNQPQSVGGRF